MARQCSTARAAANDNDVVIRAHGSLLHIIRNSNPKGAGLEFYAFGLFGLVSNFGFSGFEFPFTLLAASRALSFTFADIHQQRSHQRRPARLVASAKAHPRVAVEIFVERDVVAPINISLEIIV